MKVSGIMITRGRPSMAMQALQCFLNQDYADKELVVLDDSNDRSFADGIDHPLIRYELSVERLIGKKRNLAVGLTTGDVIAHFDSDDLYAPDRLSYQVGHLLASDKAMCAFNSVLFVDEEKGLWRRYIGQPEYAVGTSMVYLKSWWAKRPFLNDRKIGEDNHFADNFRDSRKILILADAGKIVARVHSDHTSPKDLTHPWFHKISDSEIPSWFSSGVVAA